LASVLFKRTIEAVKVLTDSVRFKSSLRSFSYKRRMSARLKKARFNVNHPITEITTPHFLFRRGLEESCHASTSNESGKRKWSSLECHAGRKQMRKNATTQ
jgi:hypothetical protein